MKPIKLLYNPCQWNPYAKIEALPNTIFEYVDENSLKIDGEIYEFDAASVSFENMATQTDGLILDAHRDADGVLCLTVRRFYTGDCPAWDTGDYHEIHG